MPPLSIYSLPFLKDPLGSEGAWLTWAVVGATSNVWSNHRMEDFLKNQFLCIGGPQKTFLCSENLIWPSKPHFWGGHTSKTF